MAAWKSDQIVHLARLWDQGHSVEDIASVMNRTPFSIQSKASRIGLVERVMYRAPEVTIRCSHCEQDFQAKNRKFKVCTDCRAKKPLPFKEYIPRPDAQQKKKLIPCLCCRMPFASWGRGNRICDECKSSEDYRYA